MIIVKVGGSVITRKDRNFSANRRLINRICKVLGEIKEEMIVIHGAGSFGHPVAKKYGIHLGYWNRSQLRGFTELKHKMQELSQLILLSGMKAKLPLAPIMPSSCLIAKKGRIARFETGPLRKLLRIGLIPMLSGDVVADEDMGFSIVSGDQLAAYLAREMKAKKVIFGCDVDGVYTDDPKRNPKARLIPSITFESFRDIPPSIKGSKGVDVTRGMYGKLKESMRLVQEGVEVVILNLNKPQNLLKLTRGERVPCTRITK